MMAKLAFITGATSGIGLATARALASNGYELALAARSGDKLEAIKKELTDLWEEKPEKLSISENDPLEIREEILDGPKRPHISTYVLDVRDRDAVKRVTKQCMDELGVPDVLINDAGLARGLEPYGDTDEEDIIQMIDTNIKGLFLVTHAFLPAMVKRNSGHIINLGSTAGLYAYAGAAVYCASKAAVKTFSDGIRIDVIASNVKVTTIQPGIVETPFSEVRFHGDTERAKAVYEGVEALKPEDIASAIVYVLSQPRRVQVSDMVIMANQQATGFMVHKK